MKKSVKKISTAGLAAALVASAIVPVASAETPATTEVAKVIVEIDGKLVQITMPEYIDLFMGGKEPEVKYITLSSEKTFTLEQYIDAFMGSDMDNEKALTVLTNDKAPTTPDAPVLEGKVDGGKIVVDTTPEENSIETFFYNLAA